MSGHKIDDWADATRPMRGALQSALQRLRETIEPAPRITQRTLMSPYILSGDESVDVSLDEVREVGAAEPIVS